MRRDQAHRQYDGDLFGSMVEQAVTTKPRDQASDANGERERALEQVADNNFADARAFELSVRAMAAKGVEFTTDDVLAANPQLEAVREKRVFGAVLMRLSRAGLIQPMGYQSSSRRVSHARPKRLWKGVTK